MVDGAYVHKQKNNAKSAAEKEGKEEVVRLKGLQQDHDNLVKAAAERAGPLPPSPPALTGGLPPPPPAPPGNSEPWSAPPPHFGHGATTQPFIVPDSTGDDAKRRREALFDMVLQSDPDSPEYIGPIVHHKPATAPKPATARNAKNNDEHHFGHGATTGPLPGGGPDPLGGDDRRHNGEPRLSPEKMVGSSYPGLRQGQLKVEHSRAHTTNEEPQSDGVLLLPGANPISQSATPAAGQVHARGRAGSVVDTPTAEIKLDKAQPSPARHAPRVTP